MYDFTIKAKAKRDTGITYLGKVNISSKIEKGFKKKLVDTFVVYLAPASVSGYNVCPKATAECKLACLHESGRNNNMDRKAGFITNARIVKTKLFFEHREFYCKWLFEEIRTAKRIAAEKGHGFAVRLNGTSDISPEILKVNGKNIFETFPDVQFYDYTKVFNRAKLLERYGNYDLTFSYNGHNWLECEAALVKGMRVAVVFERVPAFFKGLEVINGDETDLRYLDANDIIVGLKFKKVRNKIDFTQQRFVVTENHKDVTY